MQKSFALICADPAEQLNLIDAASVDSTLQYFLQDRNMGGIIVSGMHGVELQCERWCAERGLKIFKIPPKEPITSKADWDAMSEHLLDEGQPTFAIYFPGKYPARSRARMSMRKGVPVFGVYGNMIDTKDVL